MNTIGVVRIVSVTASLSFAFAPPLAAQVERARVPASACLPVSDVEFDRIEKVGQSPFNSSFFAGTLGSTHSTHRAKIYCPVPDNTAVQAEGLRWAHVHLDDGSGLDHATAFACVTFHSAIGGACSADFHNSPRSLIGLSFIDITDTKWNVNAPNGFAYIYIEMPSLRTTGPSSNLFGYSAGHF